MLWLSDGIKHWHVGEIVIITVLCRIADKALVWYLQAHPPSIMSVEFWALPIRLMILLIWGAIVWQVLVGTFYADRTGRNLREDQRNQKLGVWELYQFYKDSDPYRIDINKLPIKRWQDANGIIFGKVRNRLIYRDISEGHGEGVNCLVMGLPGSGKSTAVVIPTCLQFGPNASLIVLDIKGDVLNATRNKRNIKVFAPLDPEHSCHYDPLAPMREMDEYGRGIFVEQTAEVLIPDDGTESGKYFIETARNLFCGITLYLFEKNQDISLPDIAREVVLGNVEDWIDKISENGNISTMRYIKTYMGGSSTNLSGAYGELGKSLRPYSAGAISEILTQSDDSISPKTLDDGFDLYVEIPQDSIGILAPVTSLLVQNFMTAFMRRSDMSVDSTQRPVLFMLDEFPQLNFSYDVLSAALSTLRSKKVSIFLAVQSIGQLIKRYGDDGMREITDTMRYFAILSAQDPQSRKWCQELIGKRRVLKRTYTESESPGQYGIRTQTGNGNRSEAESEEFIFQAEDFGNLGDEVIVYANGRYIKAGKCYWFK